MVDNVRSVVDLSNVTNGKQMGPMNSPRSLEACLRKGYDPDELRPKPEKAFKQPGLSSEMVELQHAHFEKRRQEKIKIVTEERQRIIEFLTNLQQASASAASLPGLVIPGAGASGPGSGGGASSKRNVKENILASAPTPTDELEQKSGELKSQMMDLEIRRIEAVKRRQAKELSRMVEGEQKLAELQKKLLYTEEEEARRKREHEKHVAELRAEAMAKKCERDLEKKKKEESELQMRRTIAEKEQEREKSIMEEESKRSRAHALEAMARDRERSEKMAEHRKKSERAMRAQEELAEKNMLDMQAREQRLNEQLEDAKARKKVEIGEQRAKAEVRIAAALEKNKKAQADKKAQFDSKQAEAAERAMEKAIELNEKLAKQAEERDAESKLRKERLETAKQARVDRRDRIIENREKREKFYYTITSDRERKLALKKMESELSISDRVQNVARIRRIDDFLRLQTLQKIQEDDARSAAIQAEKAFLVEQRKQTAHDAFLRKQRVRECMEQMRVTNKFQSLDHLLDGSDGKKRRKKKGEDQGLSRSESAPTPRTNTA